MNKLLKNCVDKIDRVGSIFKVTFPFIVFMFLSIGFSYAQKIRTDAMGGLKFSVIDKDLSLSPYDFGGNPAWMYVDETETFLRITPEFGNSWGNYRRKYDSEGELNIGAAFHGVKKLGSKGTFSGFTSYNYENKRNYFQTLMKDTYSGEAFRLTDGTQSNFRYMGPKVILMYSFEPIEDLFAGGSVTYHLLDGLKEKFSYAKTIYRDTEINLGLAYRLTNSLVLGTNVIYFDSQESIESEDVNLLDVELYYYRGDQYFVSKRSSKMTGKIKKQGITLSSQMFWDDQESITLAAIFDYTPSNSKILKPYSSTSQNFATQSFDEVEDSYADFNNYDVQMKGQYKISEDLILSGYAGYFSNKSWSKISLKELLMWEWKTEEKVLGLGASYKLNDAFLLAVECEFTGNNADSVKFIDVRKNKINSNDSEIRFGSEYSLKNDILFRCGIKIGKKDYDLVYGGKNSAYIKGTLGFSSTLLEVVTLDANVQLLNLKADNNLVRNIWSACIGLTLSTF